MSFEKPNRKVLITHCSRLTGSETFILAHIRELQSLGAVGFAEGAPPKLLMPEQVSPGDPKVFTGDEDWTADCLQVIDEFSPDVVLAEYGPTGVMWCNACRERSVPLVVFFHGFDAGLTKVLEKFGEGYRDLFGYASAVLAPSAALLDQLTPFMPGEGLRTEVNPYGVSLERFSYRQRSLEDSFSKLLFVGRFVEKKAPQLALRAAVPFLREDSDRTLTMIGKGGLHDDCKQLAEEEELSSQVIFPEAHGHLDVSKAMAEADLFILPSQTAASGDCEGLPVVLLEAAASGLPILSTRHSGIPEFVEHEASGLLVDEGDVAGLTASIKRFAADPELRARCAENARRKVEERLTLEAHIERLAQSLATSLA